MHWPPSSEPESLPRELFDPLQNDHAAVMS